MLLSRTSEYAVRLVFHLMDHSSSDQYLHIKKIAGELEVPYYQLAKVANSLIRIGILKSYTGPNGGIKLGMSPNDLRMIDIIQPIEGRDVFERCILGLAICSGDNPCPIHTQWEETKIQIIDLFKNKTLVEFRNIDPMGDTLK